MDETDVRRLMGAVLHNTREAGGRQHLVILRTALLAAALILALPAQARNTPCSGGKGGVSHCAAGKFVCKDGSISGSKKSCPAPSAPRQRLKTAPKSKSANSCDCRSGMFCTGPRGGTYCYSDSGKKSYVRK